MWIHELESLLNSEKKKLNYLETAPETIWSFSVTLIQSVQMDVVQMSVIISYLLGLLCSLNLQGIFIPSKTLAFIDIHPLCEILTYCTPANLRLRINSSSLCDVSSYTVFYIIMQFNKKHFDQSWSFLIVILFLLINFWKAPSFLPGFAYYKLEHTAKLLTTVILISWSIIICNLT